MPRTRRFSTALAALVIGAVLPAGAAISQAPDDAPGGAPAPSIQSIIDSRGLRAADEPLREVPGWAPRKVVIMVPGARSTPDFEAGFRAVAGDVTLVFDTSDGTAPGVLEGADAVIGPCSPQLLQAAHSLFWLHSYSVGVDDCLGVDDSAFAGRVFSNSKRLSAPAMAEHAVAMLLSLARGLPDYYQAQLQGDWDRGISGRQQFGELAGKTLLVAGLGGVGTEVARRAHGLGMRVIATRHASREGPDFVDYVGLASELGTLAARADVIVNALPLTDATAGLFDAGLFGRVKPGLIYLSVGRGGTTVTADLLAALRSGRVYAAGLDVTDPEPLPKDHSLWRTPRVIVTPHIAATGGDSMRRTIAIAQENLRRYVAGEALLNPVDMVEGY